MTLYIFTSCSGPIGIERCDRDCDREGKSLEIDRNETAEALSQHANMEADMMMEGRTELSMACC